MDQREQDGCCVVACICICDGGKRTTALATVGLCAVHGDITQMAYDPGSFTGRLHATEP